MAEVNVAEKVRQIIAEKLDRKPEEVTMEAKFIDDLGADSLDITELLMALEEEYTLISTMKRTRYRQSATR